VPFFLRAANRRRWDWESSDDFSWLPAGEIPASPFGDLSPSADSALSVWLVDDDQSNFNRVVAALAAGRKHLDKFDYLLMEERTLVDLGVQVESRAEPCPDEDASARWHRNVIRLTASQLRALVLHIHATGHVRRLLKPAVESILREAVASNRLNLSRVEPSLLDSLTSSG
jgi:hypothetical protein